MFQPIPGTLQYNILIANIEQGIIKIPQFQREFVWTISKTTALLDSIIKGYPIGVFILWSTNERLRSIRNIGNVDLPDTPEGQHIQYVLDGQQRMTSLYVALRGLKIQEDSGVITDYSEIYVDLDASMDETIVTIDTEGKPKEALIKLTDLLAGDFGILSKYQKYWNKITEYSNAFKSYQFSVIQVNDIPIDIATEIFTRINVGGKPLSVFEIMVAKTYDAVRNFDLAEKYEALQNRLESVGYETVSDSTVLQAVAVCLVKECSKKQILKLDRKAFIDIWPEVESAFESAVDYFHDFYRIPVSQLLPYDALLVPFTYYFYHHKNKPLNVQKELLQDYFWRTVLTSRYSSSLESRIRQDILSIDQILQDKQPVYEEPVNISVDYLREHGWFSAGTAYIKGFLCILAYQQPQSFADNALITINNNYLKQANSKNYHHFFPKAYLRKHNVDEFRINHIANITIVDDFLNKREIRARAPSDYIGQFQKNNPHLVAALATHLIDDPETCGILTNDYELFFETRLAKFNEALKVRLLLTKADIC